MSTRPATRDTTGIPTVSQTWQLDWIAEGTDPQTGWWEAFTLNEEGELRSHRHSEQRAEDALSGCERAGWVESEWREYEQGGTVAYRASRYRLTPAGVEARIRGVSDRERQYGRKTPALDTQLPILDGLERDEAAGNAGPDGWIPSWLPNGERALHRRGGGGWESVQALMRYGWIELRESPGRTYSGYECRLTDQGRRALARGRKAAERAAERAANAADAAAAGKGRTLNGLGLGEPCWVHASGRERPGVVVEVGRTRLTVCYLRNQRGDRRTAAFAAVRVTARTTGPTVVPLVSYEEAWSN